MFFVIIFSYLKWLYKFKIGNGVFGRLVSSIRQAFWVLHGHFGPVYLLQVSKNYDEKHYFLKWFGISVQIQFFLLQSKRTLPAIKIFWQFNVVCLSLLIHWKLHFQQIFPRLQSACEQLWYWAASLELKMLIEASRRTSRYGW